MILLYVIYSLNIIKAFDNVKGWPIKATFLAHRVDADVQGKWSVFHQIV